jgi:hypothetical protein
MKRLLLILSIIFCMLFLCVTRQTFASDQKLPHGAGTLPHLTSAITVGVGIEFPVPAAYEFQYDIGLGNRVQLGLAASAIWYLGWMVGMEALSMFNVYKNSSETRFFSFYFNPGFFIIKDIFDFLIGPNNVTLFMVRPGIAYERRFGKDHNIGAYAKLGLFVPLGGVAMGETFGGLEPGSILIDTRAGLQAPLGKRVSIVLEPMIVFEPLLFFGRASHGPLLGGKIALTHSF